MPRTWQTLTLKRDGGPIFRLTEPLPLLDNGSWTKPLRGRVAHARCRHPSIKGCL